MSSRVGPGRHQAARQVVARGRQLRRRGVACQCRQCGAAHLSCRRRGSCIAGRRQVLLGGLEGLQGGLFELFAADVLLACAAPLGCGSQGRRQLLGGRRAIARAGSKGPGRS